MSLFAVIVDHRPEFVSEDSRQSCTTLPIGRRPWLARLGEMLMSYGAAEIFVIPPEGECTDYEKQIRSNGGGVKLLSREKLREFARRCEGADQMLIYDSRYLPASDMDLSELVSGPCSIPRHLVRMIDSETGTREKLVLDGSRNVLRVQRLYDGRTHLQADGIICSILNATVAARLRPGHLTDLRRLRSVMSQRGIPSHDLSISGRVYDLCDARQFLSVCDEIHGITRSEHEKGARTDGIIIGESCDIHPRARLIGPLIINRNVTMEEDSVLIGPNIIGEGAVIERGAVVANSVMLDNSRAGSHSFVHESIVSNKAHFKVSGGAACEGQVRQNGAIRTESSGSFPPYQKLKRAMDSMLSAAGLALLTPLLVFAALLVKLTSKGQAIYADEREGRDGKPFRCLKFRTMISGAHRQQRALYKHNRVDGPQFKLDDDPRITRVGKYLRMLNIDELPQLINVMRGQMSLVGPRPSPFRENQVCVAWRNARLSVTPGISGLWQMRNKRDESDFHQWIQYDLLYVRNASLWLDIKILFATALTLGGKWSVPVEWILSAKARQNSAPAQKIDHDPSIARHYLQSAIQSLRKPTPRIERQQRNVSHEALQRI